MKPNGITRTTIPVMSVICFSGCVSAPSYTTPGIQPAEATVLEKGYYWDPAKDPHQFSNAQIEAVFARAPSAIVESGERAEMCAAELAWALAVSGDQHFAQLLSRQPHNIQKSVISLIDGMWTFHKLDYPATEELAKQNALTGTQDGESDGDRPSG